MLMTQGDIVVEYVNGKPIIKDLAWFSINSDGKYQDSGGSGTIPADNLDSVQKKINEFLIEVCHWELTEENDQLQKWKKTTSKKFELEFPARPLGINIRAADNGKGAVVFSINDKSLKNTMLEIGCRILAVNGVSVEHITFEEILRIIKAAELPLNVQFRLPRIDPKRIVKYETGNYKLKFKSLVTSGISVESKPVRDIARGDCVTVTHVKIVNEENRIRGRISDGWITLYNISNQQALVFNKIEKKMSYDLNLTTLHGVHSNNFVCFLQDGEFRFCVYSDFTHNLECLGQKVRRSTLNLKQPSICAVLSELAYEASIIYLSEKALTAREICVRVMEKLPDHFKESIELIYFRHDKSDNAYLVAADKGTKHLYIAFKGTSSKQNLIKDLCCAATDPRHFQEFPCYVHSGIYRALEELLDGEDGMQNAAWFKNIGEYKCFNITGHSLGGGMAALFLGWLHGQMNSGKIPSIEIKGHSFAGPQVYATKDERPKPRDPGAQKLWRFLNENLTTYVNGHDIVPRLPLAGNTKSLSDMINVNLRFQWNEIQKEARNSSNYSGWVLGGGKFSFVGCLGAVVTVGPIGAVVGLTTVDQVGARIAGFAGNVATCLAGDKVAVGLDWIEEQMRSCLNGDFQDINKYHAVGRSLVYNPETDDYVILKPNEAKKFFAMDHYSKSVDIHVTHMNLSCHSVKGYCSAFLNSEVRPESPEVSVVVKGEAIFF